MNDLQGGWDNDPQYICIDRSSIWGNPFKLSLFDRASSLIKFEKYIRNSPILMNMIHELNGKYIVCHCHPLPCHGDVLSKIFMELSY